MEAAWERALDAIADRLARSRRVLFVTGAGLSADSGLPTYRGIGGLYQDRLTEEGVPIEEALSGETFRRRPELSWRYLHQIEAVCRGARHNRAHGAMAALQDRMEAAIVFTQNVDGLHRAAGSRDVIDIHGDLHDLVCTGCGDRRRVADFAGLAPLPRCARCGAVVRPDVVLFGELLPMAKLHRLEAELARGFDLVFSVGTSSLFPYVAWPVAESARAGVPTVEINPGRTPVSGLVDWHLPLRAVEAFDALGGRLR